MIRRKTSLFLGLPKRKKLGWRRMLLPSCLKLKFQAVLHFHLIIPYSPKFLDGYLEEMLGRENTGRPYYLEILQLIQESSHFSSLSFLVLR